MWKFIIWSNDEDHKNYNVDFDNNDSDLFRYTDHKTFFLISRPDYTTHKILLNHQAQTHANSNNRLN